MLVDEFCKDILTFYSNNKTSIIMDQYSYHETEYKFGYKPVQCVNSETISIQTVLNISNLRTVELHIVCWYLYISCVWYHNTYCYYITVNTVEQLVNNSSIRNLLPLKFKYFRKYFELKWNIWYVSYLLLSVIHLGLFLVLVVVPKWEVSSDFIHS